MISLDAPRIQAVLSECAEGAENDAGNAGGATGASRGSAAEKYEDSRPVVDTPRLRVQPRGANQRRYVREIRSRDLTFGIGPAGTGMTWLAVACALEAHRAGEVQRIVLVRPAVEAGERLGFLPGDLASKVDPYLRPVYDALYAMLGPERVAQWVERGIIEVAPLAYMRGRSLEQQFCDSRRGPEHHAGADEDVSDPLRGRLARRGDRRYHPGGPAQRPRERAAARP